MAKMKSKRHPIRKARTRDRLGLCKQRCSDTLYFDEYSDFCFFVRNNAKIQEIDDTESEYDFQEE